MGHIVLPRAQLVAPVTNTTDVCS